MTPTESTPLLPSFHPTHRKNVPACPALAVPRFILAYVLCILLYLPHLLWRRPSQPILPTTAPNPSPAPNITNDAQLGERSEKPATQTVLPQDSALVVIARSELPSTTYPTSSLKKTPSCDSILPMKEVRSVRFSAIIDIHEFSRIAGEPIGMVQPIKTPSVKIPRMESGLRRGDSERTRLTLEPQPLKSSYNHKIDDDNDYYSSRSRYGSPTY
ncbi:hypothetical protein BDV93DRAFT_522026 [Ceratobasidium sp. AG-I]|nr:hypothetical protein BDV93DRAFT_522026 [Ceratobasidium sp. AG-I]